MKRSIGARYVSNKLRISINTWNPETTKIQKDEYLKIVEKDKVNGASV